MMRDLLTGTLFVIAAASIFSSIQEFEDAYLFPNNQFMNIIFPFFLGIGILAWKHKDMSSLITGSKGNTL
jgi:hypothetical protein